jgi:sodium-coupled monocarboxylate transporter 8/12
VQAFVILLGILTVMIQGCVSVGGFKEVFTLNQEGGRLQFYEYVYLLYNHAQVMDSDFSFDPDPTTRHTFWGLSVGFCFGGLAFYGASQFTFQRFSAAKTLREAKL